jgi:hypothetical protein
MESQADFSFNAIGMFAVLESPESSALDVDAEDTIAWSVARDQLVEYLLYFN